MNSVESLSEYPSQERSQAKLLNILHPRGKVKHVMLKKSSFVHYLFIFLSKMISTVTVWRDQVFLLQIY